MKNKRFILASIIGVLFAAILIAGEVETRSITPAVVTLAASSTNTANGTILTLPDSGKKTYRIWASCSGIAASTNGVSATSNIVVRLSTASGTYNSTNEFDTASSSYIRVSIPPPGASTNAASDWFNFDGARYIRVGQIENNTLGVVSNLTIRIGYEK